MKVLVTGATGLVGRRLAELLMGRGVTVRALLRQPIPEYQAAGVDVAIGEVRQPSTLRAAVQGIDVVMHCAGVMSATAKSKDEYFAVNHMGTQSLLEAARQANVRRFVYISTVAVYGEGDLADVTEDRPPNPRSPYGLSKLRAEEALRSSTGIEWAVLRPCGIYGPREHVILPYLVYLARERTIPLLRGGKTLIDMVHVDDVCEALWLAGTKEKGAGKVFNIAGGEKNNVLDLVRILSDALGVQPHTAHISYPMAMAWNAMAIPLYKLLGPKGPTPFEPSLLKMLREDRNFSVARAAQDLGFKPSIPLKRGLTEVLSPLRTAG